MSRWVWVSLSYATFGIRVEGDRVVEAAPIARWMIGKSGSQVRAWIKGRGGTWMVLTQNRSN